MILRSLVKIYLLFRIVDPLKRKSSIHFVYAKNQINAHADLSSGPSSSSIIEP